MGQFFSSSPTKILQVLPSTHSGPGSVVSIATGYALDGPRIESRWVARLSAPVQTGPGAHPASCTVGIGSFPGIKSGRGVTLTPHPLLLPWSKKGYSYTSTLPMVRTACTEPQCLYKGALYLFFYLPWRTPHSFGRPTIIIVIWYSARLCYLLNLRYNYLTQYFNQEHHQSMLPLWEGYEL